MIVLNKCDLYDNRVHPQCAQIVVFDERTAAENEQAKKKRLHRTEEKNAANAQRR